MPTAVGSAREGITTQPFQLQGGGHHFPAEAGQMMPIHTPNLLDEAMHEEALQEAGHLRSGFSDQ